MSTSSQDPDFARDQGEILDPVTAMATYTIEFAGRRRQEEPRLVRRTAVVDTELGVTEIAAGDKVAMYYTSANRDEASLRTPSGSTSDETRIRTCRSVSPSTTAWACTSPGSRGACFFEELLATYPTIELVGDPVRTRSNLNNALKYLPIRLAR